MTPYEQELLEQYLIHLNGLGKEGIHPNFKVWYQEVRYALGPDAPHTFEEVSELRYEDILEAARVLSTAGEPDRKRAFVNF